MKATPGIDLGTTNSCIAIHDGRTATVVEAAGGGRETPSVVTIVEDQDDPLVGRSAVSAGKREPRFCFQHVKRLLGQTFHENEHQGGQVVQGPGNMAWLAGPDGPIAPQAICALVIDAMLDAAEAKLDERPTQAVITVPASAKEPQREATREAGRIAGLSEIFLIEEPTAAAIAHGATPKKFSTIVVYDWGGGTFDISVIATGNGSIDVLTTNGSGRLGGVDCDNRIVGHVAKEWFDKWGESLTTRPAAMARVRDAAETAKIELTDNSRTVVKVDYLDAAGADGVRNMAEPLTREKFEELVRELIDLTLDICKRTLEEKGILKTDIDEVILVGGMTRVPAVKEAVAAFFGKKPKATINPTEVVAIGAATWAASLDHRGGSSTFRLKNRTSHSIGVETLNDGVFVVIPKGEPLPAKGEAILTTNADMQEVVCVKAVQGDELAASANTVLARRFVRVDPAPAREASVPVTIIAGEDGSIRIRSNDVPIYEGALADE